MLDSIHSHVRHFKVRVRKFVHLLWQALRPGCLLLGKAGGTVNETTVDHALIRGLVTAGPDASRSCLGLETSVGWTFRLLVESRVLLP